MPSQSPERSVMSFQWSKTRFATNGVARNTSPRGCRGCCCCCGCCPTPASGAGLWDIDVTAAAAAVAVMAWEPAKPRLLAELDAWMEVMSCDTTRSDDTDDDTAEARGWPPSPSVLRW